MKLQENILLDSRYELVRLLGRGGFSEVWLAKDQWTHLNVAIKVYAPGQGMEEDGMKEFCGELAGVYDINHPNLLKPQHVDTWENMPYLIMAYCPNGSCAKMIGKATEEQMWKVIRDVASGLAYLHGKGLVHQDIKPANVMIDEDGDYLITDFGVSSRARSTLRKSVVSSTGGGTTAYMGPERFSKQPAPTKASDIWSFGAMCFEMVEGYVPFGENGGVSQKVGAEIPLINANVTDALKYAITMMLQKETWDRPTAATLVEWSKNPARIEVDKGVITAEEVDAGRTTVRQRDIPVVEQAPRENVQGPVTGNSKIKSHLWKKRGYLLFGVIAALIFVVSLIILTVGGDSVVKTEEETIEAQDRVVEVASQDSVVTVQNLNNTTEKRKVQSKSSPSTKQQFVNENETTPKVTKVNNGKSKQESEFLNSITIRKSLTKVSNSSVSVWYANVFGDYFNENLEDQFPYAVVRIRLEGSDSAIEKAKNQLRLNLGKMYMVESRKVMNYNNEILFLISSKVRIINIGCESGCEEVLLCERERLESDVVYDATIYVE